MKLVNNRLVKHAATVIMAAAAWPLLAFIPAYPTVGGLGDKAAFLPPPSIANHQSLIADRSTTTTLTGILGQTAPLTYTVTRAYGPRGFAAGRTLTVGQTSIPETYTYHPVLPAVASVSSPYASAAYTFSDSGRLLTKSTPATTEHHSYDDLMLPSHTAVSNATARLRAESYAWDTGRLASVETADSSGSRRTAYGYNYQGMVTAATTFTNATGGAIAPPSHLERFTYIPTGSMTARTFSPSSPQLLPVNYSLLTSPNAAFNVNRADELTRHVRNGVATITGTADPQATVTYHPTAAKPALAAEQDGTGNWVAPNIPLHPRPDGTNAIQFRIEKDGQPPMFRLSEFSVNKVTTPIGSDGNGALTNHPCSSVSISGQNIPDHLFYDCEGNLSCVSNPVSGAVDSYWYDSAGRRIAKQENGGDLVLYLWDGMEIIATANAAGEITSYFTRGSGIVGDVGSLIAETRFTSGGTASTVYLHSNWRGDVVMATDPSGTIIGEYAYTTFGEPLCQTGTYTPRFGFSSKERDASGLVYYGFRYYSPILCRWISEDPIGEVGGLNLYQFCGNDPINGIDPYGLQKGINVRYSHQPYLEGVGGGGGGGWGLARSSALSNTAKNIRVRHYTTSEGLKGIKNDMAINPSRGGGVHVETQPFGPARTGTSETGAFGKGGAYVEFNSPCAVRPTQVGPRNTAVIPSAEPVSIKDLNPTFRTIPWWNFWE